MFKNENQNLKQRIRYQDRILIVGAILLAICMIGWNNAPKDLTVYYPPDLRTGGVSNASVVPEHAVYTFAFYIFQELQKWPENGSIDYEANRKTFRAFLTPVYQSFIRDDIEQKKSDMAFRTRELHPIPGSHYQTKSVKVTGPNSWVVWLDFHVKEYLRGTLVKDVYIRYPMKVVKYEVAKEANPWQLALAGYIDEPIQLHKTGGKNEK